MKRNHHWRWDAAMQEANCTTCGAHLLVVRDPEHPEREALCDQLLALNTSNRRLKEDQVQLISASVLRNEWKPSGQGITLSTAPEVLLDGQNRLHGIKRAWRTDPERVTALYGYGPALVVYYGADHDTQAVLDRHARRSISDAMAILLSGQTIAAKVAATAACLSTTVVKADGTFYHDSHRRLELTVRQIADAYAEWKSEIEGCVGFCGQQFRIGMLAALATYWTACPEKAGQLCRRIAADDMLGRCEPAKKLLIYLAETKGARYGQARDYAVTVSACLADDEGRDLQLLREASSWRHLSGRIARFMP